MKINACQHPKYKYQFEFEHSTRMEWYCKLLNKDEFVMFLEDKKGLFNSIAVIEKIQNSFPEVEISEEVAMDVSLENMVLNPFTLRPYQKEAVEKGVEFMLGKEKKGGLLVVPTAGGKSLVIASIAQKLPGRTLVLQPSKEILEQNLKKASDFGFKDIGVFSASVGRKDLGKLTFATIGSIINKKELFVEFTNLLIDECFTGETEVLTNEGFKRFDSLNKKEKIAQWDEGSISFVSPLRHVKKEHNGPMVSLAIKRGTKVLMTPGHDQVFLDKKNNKIIKKPIIDACFNGWWDIPVSGESIEKSEELTPMERLFIATQADGNIHRNCVDHTTIAFSFTKKRKIDRLLKLAKEAKVEISSVKHSNRHAARFLVKMPIKTGKDITKHIAYPMGFNKAREVIEEMVEWDGSRLPGGNQYYFSSKDKKQTDFYSQTALLAGHGCYQSVEHDNRKETYSSMHRLFITLDQKYQGTQGCKRELINYTGNVYCVEVPSGAIVVRHGGITFVTGNCHGVNSKGGMYEEFINFFGGKCLGLTATPFRLHSYNDMKTGERAVVAKFLTRTKPNVFSTILQVTQVQELYKQGFLSPVKYEFNSHYNQEDIKLNSTGADFDQDDLERYNEEVGVVKIVSDNIKGNKSKHVLVFSSSVKEAEVLTEDLLSCGINAATISAKTPKLLRENILEEFKSGVIKVVTNVGTMTTGYDFPELDCVILARPTQSVALYYQIMGRGLRISPGKDFVRVVDICGNVSKFGRIETFEIVPTETGVRLKSDAGYLTGVNFATMQKDDLEKMNYKGKEESSGYSSDIVNFGKYKGCHVSKLPQSYLSWCMENIGEKSSFISIARRELKRRQEKKC